MTESQLLTIDEPQAKFVDVTEIMQEEIKKLVQHNINGKCQSIFKKVYSRNKDSIMYGYICYDQKNYGSAKKRKQKGMDTEGFCDIPVVQEWP